MSRKVVRTVKFNDMIGPKRIVCLTEETVETLYLLGEEDRIVGISGTTQRPPEARRDKPRVSTFTTVKTEKILELEPDLVFGFSDIQADIARELIKEGLTVFVLNHRSVAEILDMVRMVARVVGVEAKGEKLAQSLEDNLDRIRGLADALRRRPRVYFEEWFDPFISGIRWVSDLIGIAGGDDCFPELATSSLAKGRIIKDPQEVVRRRPDIIIGSWCGKKFQPDKVTNRLGWQDIPAVKNGMLFEIDSADILQPGPAALTDGVEQLHRIIASSG